MFQKDYTYAVARIRCKELTLMTAPMLEQLVSCKSYEEALRFLKDKGWGGSEDTQDGELLLAREQARAWQTVEELVEDPKALDVLRIPDDYHNLKAAIKKVYMRSNLPPERLYLPYGRLDAAELEKKAGSREFAGLPGKMAQAGQEAYTLLAQTRDGQLCDMVLDAAALEEILAAGKASHNEVLERYAVLYAVGANLKAAYRCAKTGKRLDFIRRALVPCPTLNVEELAQAAVSGVEALLEYLSQGDYAQGAEALKKGTAAFERWCDNLIIRELQPQKANPFTIGPIAAFLIAKQNEIKCARVVLSGKQNEMPEATLRERLREMYV